jgi:hypothetical protein
LPASSAFSDILTVACLLNTSVAARYARIAQLQFQPTQASLSAEMRGFDSPQMDVFF